MSKKKKKTMAIWFTGLSVSGKSTLSEGLYKKMLDQGINNVVLLDGEEIREKLKKFNYNTNDRNEIGIQKSKIALEYINSGMHTIITGIAHHKETRQIIRSMFKDYYEIYLKCNVKVCAKRDFKGNYKKAFNGEYKNFIGVTEQYEESNPELTIFTDKNTVNESLEIITKNVTDIIIK